MIVNPQKILKGLRVIIMQNGDKLNNIINGQCATYHIIQNTTVVLKLNISYKLVPIQSVTFWHENQQIKLIRFAQDMPQPFAKPKGKLCQRLSYGLTLIKSTRCCNV